MTRNWDQDPRKRQTFKEILEDLDVLVKKELPKV